MGSSNKNFTIKNEVITIKGVRGERGRIGTIVEVLEGNRVRVNFHSFDNRDGRFDGAPAEIYKVKARKSQISIFSLEKI